MAKSKKEKGKGGTNGGHEAKAHRSMKVKYKSKERRKEPIKVVRRGKDEVVIFTDSYSVRIRKKKRNKVKR